MSNIKNITDYGKLAYLKVQDLEKKVGRVASSILSSSSGSTSTTEVPIKRDCDMFYNDNTQTGTATSHIFTVSAVNNKMYEIVFRIKLTTISVAENITACLSVNDYPIARKTILGDITNGNVFEISTAWVSHSDTMSIKVDITTTTQTTTFILEKVKLIVKGENAVITNKWKENYNVSYCRGKYALSICRNKTITYQIFPSSDFEIKEKYTDGNYIFSDMKMCKIVQNIGYSTAAGLFEVLPLMPYIRETDGGSRVYNFNNSTILAQPVGVYKTLDAASVQALRAGCIMLFIGHDQTTNSDGIRLSLFRGNTRIHTTFYNAETSGIEDMADVSEIRAARLAYVPEDESSVAFTFVVNGRIYFQVKYIQVNTRKFHQLCEGENVHAFLVADDKLDIYYTYNNVPYKRQVTFTTFTDVVIGESEQMPAQYENFILGPNGDVFYENDRELFFKATT